MERIISVSREHVYCISLYKCLPRINRGYKALNKVINTGPQTNAVKFFLHIKFQLNLCVCVAANDGTYEEIWNDRSLGAKRDVSFYANTNIDSDAGLYCGCITAFTMLLMDGPTY